MPHTYFLPRGEADALRSKAQVAQHFGQAALGRCTIRPGRRWNKVEVQAAAGVHDAARSLIYLGLLDARTGSPFP